MDRLRYILDTDIFSYVVGKRHPDVRRRFMEKLSVVGISSITYAESVFGAVKRGAGDLMSLIGLFSEMIKILPWTENEAHAYAAIRNDIESKGTPIGVCDMLIAAVALANGLTLVTNNTAHFSRVSGLKFENWIQGN